jgi:hypothetical protein
MFRSKEIKDIQIEQELKLITNKQKRTKEEQNHILKANDSSETSGQLFCIPKAACKLNWKKKKTCNGYNIT